MEKQQLPQIKYKRAGVLLAVSQIKEYGQYPTTCVKEILINTFERYPQDLIFTLLNNRTDIITQDDLGKTVEITFKLKEDKYIDKTGIQKYSNKFIAYGVTFDETVGIYVIEENRLDRPPAIVEPKIDTHEL